MKAYKKLAELEAKRDVLEHIYCTIEREEENLQRYKKDMPEDGDNWYEEQIESTKLRIAELNEIAKKI